MKRVLVIGANSYIGKRFHEYVYSLKEKLIDVDLVSAADGSWEKVDFTIYDSVLHLSAIVHKKEKSSMEELYERVNHRLPVEVACRAKSNGVAQFVFMSTAAVYGSRASIITKETIPDPDTYYGKSKLEAEQELVKIHNDKFKVAILRTPMVYGYGCKGNFQRLMKLAKIVPIFPDIKNKRSMIYIENLCELLRLLIEQEKWGYFYPQNEEYVCTSEIVKSVGETMSRKIHFTKMFNPAIKMLGKKVPVVEKMFGDWYYKMDEEYQTKLSENETNSRFYFNSLQLKYQVVDFNASIHESI